MTPADRTYRSLLRPILFRLDAEAAHDLTLAFLERFGTLVERAAPGLCVRDQRLAIDVAGLRFPNPVGLAAGCDKNGRAVDVWPRLGFGFTEIGTITGRAQPGNPRPRMRRFPEHDAILNRLGFNNEGAEAVARRLKARYGRMGVWVYECEEEFQVQISQSEARHGHSEPRIPNSEPGAPTHPHTHTHLGINIGKSKVVGAPDDVIADYLKSLGLLYPFASYFTINVSSPNTPGLREWQEKGRLTELLSALQHRNRELAGAFGCAPDPGISSAASVQGVESRIWLKTMAGLDPNGEPREGLLPPYSGRPGTPSDAAPPRTAGGAESADGSECRVRPKPLFVKVDPDLSAAALDGVVEATLELGLAGIIATNTTVGREGVPEAAGLPGGLSGRPLFARSTETLRTLYHLTEGRLPLIGVGGIFSAEDAYQKLLAGASLVQLYTGFVYEGPGLIRRINEGLLERMERDGVKHVSELIGRGAAG